MAVVEDALRRRSFAPADALELHRQSRAWLEGELAKAFAGPTVVVTHHAPHPNSVESRFRADPVTPAFVSDLSLLIERWQPHLWIHGHTHTGSGGYQPDLVIEV